ncbi:MAG: hypothetical protein ABR899_03145 [Candidatus Krumholzibacteriaceae bacterium]
MKRRPVPKKKRSSRLEPDSKSKQRDILDKKTKKYGVNVILEEVEEVEEIEEEFADGTGALDHSSK